MKGNKQIFERGIGRINDDCASLLDWERRVFIVAITGLLPGLLLGSIVGIALTLFAISSSTVVALGGLIGIVLGGLFEADHLL